MSPLQIPITPEREAVLVGAAERIGHAFEDLSLLDRALTHSSLGNLGRASYERLEFLGDAILGMLVAEHLYLLTPEIPQGELTDRRAGIVSRPPLAKVAHDLRLADALAVGRGLSRAELTSKRILADLVEAVLGAVHLDGGIEASRRFVEKNVLRIGSRDSVESVATTAAETRRRDPKSRLLHYTQRLNLGQPDYLLVSTEGPDHQRTFHIEVRVAGESCGSGSASTKQAAEKLAAEQALDTLPTTDEADDATDESCAEADGG